MKIPGLWRVGLASRVRFLLLSGTRFFLLCAPLLAAHPVFAGALPAIVSQPQSQFINTNQGASLLVAATGTPPLVFQWRKDGEPLADGGQILGSASSNLFVFNFAATNAGDYSVVVTNDFGSVTSAVATLAPASAPVITGQPTNVFILTNHMFTLSVTATGAPAPSYQWRKGAGEITGATNGVFNGVDTNFSALGDYSCRVTNLAGAVTSDVARVEVYFDTSLFTVNPAPTNATLLQGGSLTELFQVYGLPPVTFTWRRDGLAVPGFAGVPPSYLTNTTTFASLLSLADLQPADSGGYQAIASNNFGFVASVVFTVSVLSTGAPVILQSPSNFTTFLGFGSSVIATQNVRWSSASSAGVQWFTNGVPAAGETSSNLLLGFLQTGSVDVVATVSNQSGAATSAVGTVTVTLGPGSPDTNFLVASNLNGSPYALAALPDGGLIAGGTFTTVGAAARNHLARFDTNSTLAAWLAASNALNGAVFAIHRLDDGRLLIGGDFTDLGASLRYSGLARLNGDGSLDETFLAGTNSGRFIDSRVQAIAVRASDGFIAVGGDFTNVAGVVQRALAFFNSNGVFQAALRPDLMNDPGTSPEVGALAFQSDGRLLLGGNFTNINGSARNNLARLNNDGSLDATFNPASGVNGPVIALLALTDGRVTVGGNFTQIGGVARNGLARLTAGGAVETNFTVQAPFIEALALQDNGNVIAGGGFSAAGAVRPFLTRATNGVAHGLFPGNGLGTPDGVVRALAFAFDGSLWIGGDFTLIGGVHPSRGLARLLMDSAPPAPAPTLGTVFLSAGNLSFSVPTGAGRAYQVQFKNALGDALWQVHSTLNGNGTNQTVTIPAIGAAAFFRLVVLP